MRTADYFQYSWYLDVARTNTKKSYQKNINYDVPWLHFNFICGPPENEDMYRCKSQPSFVITNIPKRKEFTIALENGTIPSLTSSSCCDLELDLAFTIRWSRVRPPIPIQRCNSENPSFDGDTIVDNRTILFGTLMFLADENDPTDLSSLNSTLEWQVR